MKKRSLPGRFLLAFGLLLVAAACAQTPSAHKDRDPVVIMPLGDSITQGLLAGGYRASLCAQLTRAGCAFRFVGSQTISPAPVLTSSGNEHHEGHGGYTLAHILNNLNGGTSNGGHWLDGLPGTREAVYPDVILLMIGTNDLGSHRREVAPVLADYDTLLTKLTAMRPKSAIIVSTLIPYTGSVEKYPSREQHQREFNAALPALVKKHQAAGRQVVFYDMRTKVLPEHISSDGVHPSQAGYNAIADGWFEALQALPLLKIRK